MSRYGKHQSTEHLKGLIPARYELVEWLGEGGMATVWAARDTLLEGEDADIALKVLHPHLLADELVGERFRREVIAARGLHHPHIVRVHDLIEGPDVLAISMSRHRGVDLRRVLRERGTLTWQQTVSVIDALLGALECAHAAGVIHRDIKPENIMVGAERLDDVQLMDFGLARVDALIGITTHTTTLGSVDYMAPEQLQAVTLDARVDLYAVGVVCYELLTGERPFQGATPMQLARAHAEQPVPKIEVDGVPAFANEFLAIAMAKDPAHRFATAHEMRQVWRGELPMFRSMAHRRAWRCSTCDEPLVASWSPCLSCGRTTMVTAQAGRAKVYLPASPMFRAGSAKLGRKDAISEQQKHKVVQLLAEPRWGIKADGDAHRQVLRLQSLPVVLTRSLDVESAQQMAQELREIGLPARYTDGSPGATVKYYQRIMLNRKIVPFAAAGTLAFPFLGCMMTCLVAVAWAAIRDALGLSDDFADHWLGMIFVLAPVGILAMAYVIFFLWGARSMTAFDDARLSDERAAWLPSDAAQIHGSLKLERTRALYRAMLARTFELRERAGHWESAPDSLLDALGQLPALVGQEIQAIDALERQIHASSPSQIHEAMQRAQDVRDHSEHAEEIEQAIGAMMHARQRLQALDEAHRELASHHQRVLELEHRLADMAARLKQGEAAQLDEGSLERTVLEFAVEVESSSATQRVVAEQFA